MREKKWKKLIVERPRVGGTRRLASKQDRAAERRKTQVGAWDDLPKMQRLYSDGRLNDRGGVSKNFSDYLNPLRRWLDKQVGRLWDDVFSELRAMVDNKSTTGRHVYQHLASWLHTNVVVYDNGEVWEHGKYGPNKLFGGVGHRSPDLYVDPKTGILTVATEPVYWKTRRKIREEDSQFANRELLEKDGHRYQKVEGIWYETTPRTVIRSEPIYEVIYLPPTEGLRAYQRQQKILVGHREVAVTVYDVKRQLSTKELRRLGLVNDSPKKILIRKRAG